jgi:hypothetical protein
MDLHTRESYYEIPRRHTECERSMLLMRDLDWRQTRRRQMRDRSSVSRKAVAAAPILPGARGATSASTRRVARSACRHPPFRRPRLELPFRELGFRGREFGAGGEWRPRIPPSLSAEFPLVRDLLGPMGESAALVTWPKKPVQRAFLDEVELGGIEPPSIRR